MATADDKAYEAQLAELVEFVPELKRRQQSIEGEFQTSLGYASASEARTAETAERAAEHIDRSLMNARQAVHGLLEDTLIPPRMKPSSVMPNVGASDVESALGDLDRAVIELRTLADAARRALATPLPKPRNDQPVVAPASRHSPVPLVIGALIVLLIVVVFLVIQTH